MGKLVLVAQLITRFSFPRYHELIIHERERRILFSHIDNEASGNYSEWRSIDKISVGSNGDVAATAWVERVPVGAN